MSSHYACESRDLQTVVDYQLNQLDKEDRGCPIPPFPVRTYHFIGDNLTYLPSCDLVIMFSLLFQLCDIQNTLNTFIFVLFPHPIISSFDAGGGNRKG